jgi:membrane fusion protein (multidrug efflux system)
MPADARQEDAARPGTPEASGPAKSDGEDKKEQPRTRWPLILLAVVVVLGAIAGGLYWYSTRNLVSTDDAFTDGRAVTISPQVSGTVVTLAVNDNQFVHAGDLLVQIDERPYVAARDEAEGQLKIAEAQLENARLALEKARISYPAALLSAQGQLAQAEGQMFKAQSDYKRQHGIDPKATSQESIDQATASLRQVTGQVQQAEGQVRQQSLVSQNIAQAAAQVDQLGGQVEQARANLARAELNLGYARVTAPQDGWVTKRNVELGDYLQPGGQSMALVTPEVWVTANFKETQLSRMRRGQRVDISVDAYPGLKLTGHVDSIQLGTGAKFTAFPAENATGNFVKIVQRVPVKIVIDHGLDPSLPLALSLSVEPTVTVQ